MNHAPADGSMSARRVDWVRPAKDTTVVAGEQPGCFWHVTHVHFFWVVRSRCRLLWRTQSATSYLGERDVIGLIVPDLPLAFSGKG